MRLHCNSDTVDRLGSEGDMRQADASRNRLKLDTAHEHRGLTAQDGAPEAEETALNQSWMPSRDTTENAMIADGQRRPYVAFSVALGTSPEPLTRMRLIERAHAVCTVHGAPCACHLVLGMSSTRRDTVVDDRGCPGAPARAHLQSGLCTLQHRLQARIWSHDRYTVH